MPLKNTTNVHVLLADQGQDRSVSVGKRNAHRSHVIFLTPDGDGIKSPKTNKIAWVEMAVDGAFENRAGADDERGAAVTSRDLSLLCRSVRGRPEAKDTTARVVR